MTDYKKIVVRLVVELYRKYMGQVKKKICLKESKIDTSKRRVFMVKYYRGVLEKGQAKEVVDYTKEELLPLLVVRS